MTTFENIKKTAQERGLNLKTVATKAGLSENAIYSWRNKNPRTESLQAVADVLGVSVDYLLGNTDEMHPSKSDEPVKKTMNLDEALSDEGMAMFDGKPLSEEYKRALLAMLRAQKNSEN